MAYPQQQQYPQGGYAVNAPVYVMPPVIQNPLISGKWDSGLCECFSDIGNCLFSIFCAPCAVGDIAKALGHDWCLYCLCGQGWFSTLRFELMKERGIPHEPCCGCAGEWGECCRTCFCGSCSLCQMGHEAKLLLKVKEQLASVPLSPMAR